MIPSTDALLDGLLDWVRIETHTPDTAGLNSLMDLVQRQAEGFGATCQRFPGREGKGDHLLVLSPWGDHEQKGVLLLSHLDTVHPKGTIERDLPIRIEEDRCFGPGICDMKGGAFNGLAAMRAIAESGITPPLPARILFTSDEEVGSPTSRAPDRGTGKTRQICAGDGTGPQRRSRGNRAQGRRPVHAEGRGASVACWRQALAGSQRGNGTRPPDHRAGGDDRLRS